MEKEPLEALMLLLHVVPCMTVICHYSFPIEQIRAVAYTQLASDFENSF